MWVKEHAPVTFYHTTALLLHAAEYPFYIPAAQYERRQISCINDLLTTAILARAGNSIGLICNAVTATPRDNNTRGFRLRA